MTVEFPGGRDARDAGDIDGDGNDDVLVVTSNRGAPFVALYGESFVTGRVQGLGGPVRGATFTCANVLCWPQLAVPVGDVNGDGFGDILLGAFCDASQSAGSPRRSWVLLVPGGDIVPGTTIAIDAVTPGAVRILAPESDPTLFCGATTTPDSGVVLCASGGGDVNGDGVTDFLIGAYPKRPGTTSAGMVLVIAGRRNWPAEIAVDALIGEGSAAAFTDPPPGNLLPVSAAFVGDVDGGGRADISFTHSTSAVSASAVSSARECRSYVVFGESLRFGAKVPIAGIGNAAWSIDRVAVSGSPGDVDGDGRSELLLFDVPAEVGQGASRGFLVYGAPRADLHALSGPADLVFPMSARFATLPLGSESPADCVLDPGVRTLGGGKDVDGDGVSDFIVGLPTRSVWTGAGLRVERAGQACVARGARTRREELPLVMPAREGLFCDERIGQGAFFARIEARTYVVIASRVRNAHAGNEALLVTYLPFPLPACPALSVERVVVDTLDAVTLLGAGFENGMAVLFGGVPSSRVEVVSHSITAVAVPQGEAGTHVDVEVVLGSSRALAPGGYTYPPEDLTPTIDLARLRNPAGGATRLFSSSCERVLRGGILAGDVDGDGQCECVLAVGTAQGPELLVLGRDALAGSEVDLADVTPEAVVRLAEDAILQPELDAGDFDGDGINDTAVEARLGAEGSPCWLVFFGGLHLRGEVTLAPGSRDLLVVHGPNAVRWPTESGIHFPGDVDGDGVLDLVGRWPYYPDPTPQNNYGLYVLRGGPWWREAGERHMERLAAEGKALILEGGLWLAPADRDDAGTSPALVVACDLRKLGGRYSSANYGLLLVPDRIPAGLCGLVTLAEFAGAANATVNQAPYGYPSLVLRGPNDVNGRGADGLLLADDRDTVPNEWSRGRLVIFDARAAADLPPGVPEPIPDAAIVSGDPGTARGFQLADRPGRWIAPLGDFDGDGATDFLVPVFRGGMADESYRVLLLRGGLRLLAGERRYVGALGGDAVDLAVSGLGCTLATSPPGDLDGDGLCDAFVGFGAPDKPTELYLVRGRVEPLWSFPWGVPFSRGDANGDGRLDIADAVRVLAYLFGGGAQPGCMDAADANDDERLDIADPVRILAYLFSAGAGLAAPFGSCGSEAAPSRDGLSCLAFPPCGT